MPIFVPSHTMKAASVIPAPRFLRMQFPRVCTVVIAQNPADLLEKVEQVCRDNSFIEVRLDYLSKPALAFPRLKQFFASHRDITAIATCRRAVNGGHFRGSVASQYELLIKAAQNGFRRSEERRVGKEGRSRWAADHLKKKKTENKRRE